MASTFVCIALFAAVAVSSGSAQICNNYLGAALLPGAGLLGAGLLNPLAAQGLLGSGYGLGFTGSAYPGSSGCGVYPVTLNNNGPCAPIPPPAVLCPVTAPTVTKPTIVTPAPCIPGPRTISNNCCCTKTVVSPQVYQRTINVPAVQNVVSTGYTPVTETINYTAIPTCNSGLGLAGLGLNVASPLGLGLAGSSLGLGLAGSPLGLGLNLAATSGLGLGLGSAYLGASAIGLGTQCGC